MADVYDPQARQTEMMQLFGQTVRRVPALPTREEQVLRARLMFEEAGVEMIRASGCRLAYDGVFLDLDKLSVEPIPGQQADQVAVADSIADTLVVTYGAANCYGQNAQRSYAEVHRSNMSKTWDSPGGPEIRKRDDGKVLKPDTYSPADLGTVLEVQRVERLQQLVREADALEEALAADPISDPTIE